MTEWSKREPFHIRFKTTHPGRAVYTEITPLITIRAPTPPETIRLYCLISGFSYCQRCWWI